MFSKIVISIIFFAVLSLKLVWGNDIFHIPPSPPTIGSSVSFEAVISIDLPMNEAIFLYRLDSQDSYKEIEMEEDLGGTWKTTITKVPDSNEIEYFFIFNMLDGSSISLPGGEPGHNPYLLSVIPLLEAENYLKGSKNISSNQGENSFLILSPDENDIIYSDALHFMVSFYNIADIDISSVHLYIGDQDVTIDALLTTDILIYSPKQVKPGINMFKITASTNNGSAITSLYHTIPVISHNKSTSNFSYSVNGTSELSMDQVEMEQGDDESLNIYQTNLSIKAGWPRLQFKSRLKITSEESPFKQPKNRYTATLKSGSVLKINVGDFTPYLSPYSINGKRLRGIGTEWRLGWLQFQSAHGLLDREIQGLYNIDRSYKISNISLDDTGIILYELDRIGYTFRNDLSSYRLALNIQDKIIFGSTLMKTKNNVKSVEKELSDASLTVLLDTTFETAAQLDAGTYTFAEFQDAIEANNISYGYELLEKGWSGNKPQQNLVLGTDFRLSLDEHNFLLEGYWAFSLLNKDIWDGTMTLAELDTLMGDSLDGLIYGLVDTTSIPDPSDFEEWMTLNMNLVPIIPIDMNAFGDSATVNLRDAILNMPSTAYNLKFRSLYFNNTFELQYSQVGPEFTSLANPYFPKNTREFSISDKIWLFDRRLQTAASYKVKTNDILKTTSNPYNEEIFGINLNFLPGFELPSAMYGYQSILRTNTKTAIDTLIAGEDTTLQDLRVDFMTTNNLFTINVPIQPDDVSYSIGGTYNLIVGEDRLENKRLDTLSYSVDTTSTPFDTTYTRYLSQASKIQLISLVFGARYNNGRRLSLNISNFTNNHIELGKTKLNSASITGTFPLFQNKMSLSGTLSYLHSSGLSEFKNYGLSLGSMIKISNTFKMNLAASFKTRSTTVKLSTNYIF